MQKCVFLSYNSNERKVIDTIDNFLSKHEIQTIYDKKDLKLMDRLEVFMKKVSESDYIISLISNAYLESMYCMYEGLLTLDCIEEKKEKIELIPIVREGTEIYKLPKYMKYFTYWNDQYLEYEQMMRDIPFQAQTDNLKFEFKLVESIKNNIFRFITHVNKIYHRPWNNNDDNDDLLNDIYSYIVK